MKEADFITYLSGASIKDENFIGLKEVSVEILKKYEKLLVFNLKFLLMSYPEKIIDLYNLEIEYIDNLMKRELNQNLNMTIDAGIKAASSTKNEDIMTVVYLMGFLDKENQLIFKHVLERKMKEKNIKFHIFLVKTAEKILEESFSDWLESNKDDPEQEIVFCTKGNNLLLDIDDSIN